MIGSWSISVKTVLSLYSWHGCKLTISLDGRRRSVLRAFVGFLKMPRIRFRQLMKRPRYRSSTVSWWAMWFRLITHGLRRMYRTPGQQIVYYLLRLCFLRLSFGCCILMFYFLSSLACALLFLFGVSCSIPFVRLGFCMLYASFYLSIRWTTCMKMQLALGFFNKGFVVWCCMAYVIYELSAPKCS